MEEDWDHDEVELPPQQRRDAPVLWPSLKVGALAGTAGALVGGTAGVIRTTTPVLFAVGSGIQCSALGTTFWATRTAVLNAWNTGDLGTSDRRKASAIAGAISGGTVGALARGRSNIIPGIIVMSGLGYLGQWGYDSLDAQNTAQAAQVTPGPEGSIWVRMAKSKWSPMKFVSDEEYEQVLQEKILKVDVEIALINERIEQLKKPGPISVESIREDEDGQE